MKRIPLILFFFFVISFLLSYVEESWERVETSLYDQKEYDSTPSPERLEKDMVFKLEKLLADDSIEATRELETLVLREDVIGYLANLALTERELEKGRSKDVFFQRALVLYPTTAIRLQLANYLTETKRNEEAIAEYLLAVPAQEALDALDELDAPVMEVVQALLKSNRQKTLDYIHKHFHDLCLSSKENIVIISILGESYAILGDYRKALPYLETAYKEGKDVSFWYARSLELTGAIEAASSIYQEMGASGAHRLGNILLQQGDQEEGARVFLQSDNPIALWQSARIWEELEPSVAIETYQKLAQGESRYRDDAAYRAYILMERKGLEGTEEMLEILKEYPAWSIRVTGKGYWKVVDDPVYTIPNFLESVELLEELGYPDWAKIELAINRDRRKLTDMLALGDWHYQRGEYYLATVWGMRSLLEEKTRRGYLLAYPRPFHEHVLKYAAQYRVEPHLIWAVMREESHFRPTVVSPAGALGLMQIMPGTGQEIAGRLNMRISYLDLLIPEINISFGVFYLRQMLNLFGDNVDKALAAYNGGQGNVQRWSNSILGNTPADFPTAITFVETREFLTKVLNTYHTYNWLYGDN